MKPICTRLFACLAAILFCGQAMAFEGPYNRQYGFGHARTVTRLSANLTDANPQGLGHGEVNWISDSANGRTTLLVGVSLPVGAANVYGLADSNTASNASATLVFSHGGTAYPYACTLHVNDMYFVPPQTAANGYEEFAEYALSATQVGGNAVGKVFGSCANFPATLSAGDTVSVAIGSSSLNSTLVSN